MISTTQKLTGNYGLERFLLNAFRITRLFSSEKFLCASAVGALPASGSNTRLPGSLKKSKACSARVMRKKMRPFFCASQLTLDAVVEVS